MTARKKKSEDIILSAKNIVNRFGAQVVHDGVSLEVHRGEILGIAGGSGSGKSVLLKTLIGLRRPDKGTVKINGKSVADIKGKESASLIGVLFQDGALFSSLNVEQNIMFPLREYTDLNEEERRIVALFKLALTGLSGDVGQKQPSELSGGMTRRAALARALVMDPSLLFLDEPTSALDPINASAFDRLISDLNSSMDVTVVMVTHDLDTLFTLCDRVGVLVDGQLVCGTVAQLLKNGNPWIQEFFHGPRGQGAAVAARSMHGDE